jgi:hypothetical protein
MPRSDQAGSRRGVGHMGNGHRCWTGTTQTSENTSYRHFGEYKLSESSLTPSERSAENQSLCQRPHVPNSWPHCGAYWITEAATKVVFVTADGVVATQTPRQGIVGS